MIMIASKLSSLLHLHILCSLMLAAFYISPYSSFQRSNWVKTLGLSVIWLIHHGNYLVIPPYLPKHLLQTLNANLLYFSITWWHRLCFMNLSGSSNRELSYPINSINQTKPLTDGLLVLYLFMKKGSFFPFLYVQWVLVWCCTGLLAASAWKLLSNLQGLHSHHLCCFLPDYI